MKRIVAVVLVIALAVVLGSTAILLVRSSPPPQPPEEDPGASAEKCADPAVADAVLGGWKVGDRAQPGAAVTCADGGHEVGTSLSVESVDRGRSG